MKCFCQRVHVRMTNLSVYVKHGIVLKHALGKRLLAPPLITCVRPARHSSPCLAVDESRHISGHVTKIDTVLGPDVGIAMSARNAEDQVPQSKPMIGWGTRSFKVTSILRLRWCRRWCGRGSFGCCCSRERLDVRLRFFLATHIGQIKCRGAAML